MLRFQGVMLFVLLEVVSLFLFITSSSYQRAAVLNSANAYAGVVLARRTEVTDYFRLVDLNKQLLADNARLRQRLYPPTTPTARPTRCPWAATRWAASSSATCGPTRLRWRCKPPRQRPAAKFQILIPNSEIPTPTPCCWAVCAWRPAMRPTPVAGAGY
ncbi:MAG: hypothetical protein WKG07_15525 [Hymenobacter sp.]